MTREEPTKAMIERAAMTGRLRREQCYTVADQIEADGAEIARLSAAFHNSEAVRVKLEKAAADRQAAPVAHIHFAGGLLSGAPADVDAAVTEIARLTAERDSAIAAISNASRARGLAEGKLAAAGWPGVINAWKVRVAELEAALRPFGEAATRIDECRDERPLWAALDADRMQRDTPPLTAGHLRRAREALERKL